MTSTCMQQFLPPDSDRKTTFVMQVLGFGMKKEEFMASISKEQSSTANRVVVARLMEALSDICKEQVDCLMWHLDCLMWHFDCLMWNA